MNKVILDASALLALLNQETGYKMVEEYLPLAIMSAVNLSEVMAVLMNVNIPHNSIEEITSELVGEIIPFDQRQASVAASLRKITKPYGLSFGDRACLSLAKLKKLPVLTADKIWSKLQDDIEIKIIR